jgi:hypothetical protein
MRVITAITALACALTIGVVVTSAQDQGRRGGGPPAPSNLQVLPKDMTGPQVSAYMQTVRQALGVQCTHCHVGGPADRAKDDMPTKMMARNMMKMVNGLNDSLGGTMAEPKVTCFTCHRGSIKPATAPDGGL